MTAVAADIEKILRQFRKLSSNDKVRLVEELIDELEAELPQRPRRSLYGLWAGVDISAEDIAALREELWQNFPREDL